jgi:hypothetical protein
MKQSFLHFIMFLLFAFTFFSPSSYSQNPTSRFILTHDTWDNHKIYKVDIYLQSTDANPIELAIMTLGIALPEVCRNGGTITASFVAGTTELTNTAQFPTSMSTASTMTAGGVLFRQIRINGKVPPGPGNGSMIATGFGATGPGTRIATLQLVNTVDFVVCTFGVCPQFMVPGTVVTTGANYPCAFNAYIGGINTVITANSTFTNIFVGPLCPVELSSFGSNVNGRDIVLNWETKTEKNSNKFEIERNLMGTDWVPVGSVKACVLSNSPKQYSFMDKNLQSGKYQYRLMMIDNDGSYEYSKVIEAEVDVPENYELSQNYPNPFNPNTVITYSLPLAANMKLTAYNTLGQVVKILDNGFKNAGNYTVNFDASELTSGTYFYRLEAGQFTQVKKMILIK